jgi:hypothetical protein
LPHWDPSAIITGAAAARLTFWPTARVGDVECAVHRTRTRQPGYRFIRRVVPSELVVERSGARLTSAALTALDLAAVSGGDAIEEVLRARASTLGRLHQALDLTPDRSTGDWRVLRFTWAMLTDQPEDVIAAVCRALVS